jgi:two-component system, sensor histidine kinase and response regulator
MLKEKILIVDDEPAILAELSDFLEGEGFSCIASCSGREAVEIYKKDFDNIDLVVLDLNMRGMDGDETLVELRKIKPGVIVIMLTAFGNDPAKIKKSIQLGARGYVQKNFSDDGIQLLSKINDLLELQRIKKQEHIRNMGKLAGSIAHYMKNALWNIKGRAELLSGNEIIAEIPDAAKSLQIINRIVDESTNVLFSLLHFSGKTETKFAPQHISLLPVINQICELLEPELKRKNIQLEIEKSKISKVVLKADDFQLGNALYNICQNAIEAVERNGKIKIDFQKNYKKKEFSILIIDNGMGMDKAILDQVSEFSPFFSNKEGIGLGLHATKRVMDLHEGKLGINSQKGKGTTVKLSFKLDQSVPIEKN